MGDAIVAEAEPAAGGQGERLMAARATAFSKGPPPETPAELNFFGRALGDPRRRRSSAPDGATRSHM
eukprot:13322428-Alexandrium_andersonii.AAC.1